VPASATWTVAPASVTFTPAPSSTPTERPTAGTLRIAIRHADGSPMLHTRTQVFMQAVDINGDPILGASVMDADTGDTGAAMYTLSPGAYVVLLSIGGPRFRTDVDSPGFPNVLVSAGSETDIDVGVGSVVSSAPGAYLSCLVVKPATADSPYDASCSGFANGLSRVEALPGTYTLSFTIGDIVQTYADAGSVTITAGQTIQKQCSITGIGVPRPSAECD
jgi:hypothetical protein